MDKKSKLKGYKVHSLERGLDLIEILAEANGSLSLSEISKLSDFNPSTAHRILNSLKGRGYVRQNRNSNNYCLSFKLIGLASKIGWRKLLRDEAHLILADLAEKTKQTAYLIVLDGDEALCLDRIDGNPHITIATLEIGGHMPMNMGAGPRVLMAYLSKEEQDRVIENKGLVAWTADTITNPLSLKKNLGKIKKDGYAFSDQDVTEGVAALGCPVYDYSDKVIAALSIAGVSSSYHEKQLPFLIDSVRQAADDLGRKITNKSDKET